MFQIYFKQHHFVYLMINTTYVLSVCFFSPVYQVCFVLLNAILFKPHLQQWSCFFLVCFFLPLQSYASLPCDL